LLWRVRVSEAPPGYLHFAVHPWVVSNDRLKEALDWRPRHTSRETFELTMRARGLIEGGPDAAAERPQMPVGA
jgi:hypothetical protein